MRVPLNEVLVEDRELDQDGEDKFGHDDIVEQIVDLVTTVKPPANVALYGPWGSGKSSLANHLDKRLDNHEKAKFVRYDAFKFAKLPLQRHFIRHLATELGIKDPKFGEGLYHDEDSDDLTFQQPETSAADTDRWFNSWWPERFKKWWYKPSVRTTRHIVRLLVVVFAIGLVLAMAFTAIAAGIGSWISEKDSFADTFADYMKDHLLGFLAPAGLLGLFGTVVTQKLTVKRHRSAPTSDDEMSERFRDLVLAAREKHSINKKPRERLVVFIDELDRCDGPTVVVTLESLRTFLDSPDCIIVVAADQHVLETALTEHLRQATPVDVANPYYSAGSEYLDKTFHYQLALPPLLSRRLSNYAAELLEDKHGPWDEVPIGRVVSVLVPNHVRSPRRAKTLLNAYALTYELAAKRVEDKLLAGPILDRCEELAVLTCLRVEFPLFARELVRYPRLVRACRAVIRDLPRDGFDKDTWARAQEFMSGRCAAATVLVDEPDSSVDLAAVTQVVASAVSSAVTAVSATSSSAAAPEPKVPAPDPEVPEPLETEPVAEPTEPSEPTDASAVVATVSAPLDGDAQAIREAQSTLLRRYLQKTASVPGPAQDLIHLAGAGTDHGLDPVDAEQLEDLATQRDTAQTWDLVTSLDTAGRIGALRSLADALRDDVALGIEADNLASTLLWLYSRILDDHTDDGAFADAKEYVAGAIAGHLDSFELQPYDLEGAFCLALDLDNQAGRRLVAEVLDHASAGREPGLVSRVLQASDELSVDRRPRVQELLSGALLDDGMRGRVGAALGAIDTDHATELFDAVLDQVTNTLHARVAAATADETVEDADKAAAEKTLIDSLVGMCPSSVPLQRRVATILVGLDTQEARNNLFALLPGLKGPAGEKIMFKPLVVGVLIALGRRNDEQLLRAFDDIDLSVLTDDERRLQASRLTSDRWHAMTRQSYVEWTTLQPALKAIGTLAGAQLDAETGASKAPVASIKVPTTTDEGVQEATTLNGLRVYLTPGTVDPVPSIEKMVEALTEVLGAAYVAPEPGPGLEQWAATAAQLVCDFGTTEQTQSVIDLVGESDWFPEATVAALSLYLRARARGLTPASPVTLDSLLAMSPQTDESIHALAARWLVLAAPAPADAARLIAALRGHITDGMLEAIREYVATLSGADRIELIRAELRTFLDGPVTGELLDALGLGDLPDGDAGEAIVDVFAEVRNRDQRKRFLEAWERARITDPAAREKLIREVLIPIGRSGVGGVDLLTRFSGLFKDPPPAVHDELLMMRRDLDQPGRRRLRDVFVDAGLIEQRRRVFRGDEFVERWLGTPPSGPIEESDDEEGTEGDASEDEASEEQAADDCGPSDDDVDDDGAEDDDRVADGADDGGPASDPPSPATDDPA